MGRLMDLHVTLPETTARAMDRLAHARGLKRTEVLRLAVERLLAQAQREARDAAMRAYVAEMAPHSRDFVRETAAEVRKRLLEDAEW